MALGPRLTPRPSWPRRLDAAARFSLPVAVLVLGLVLLGVKIGLPLQAELRPAFALACVFFWSLYRPASLPPPLVALCGVLLDLLGLTPIGLWAVMLLLLQGVTLAARRGLSARGFALTWLVFCGLAAGFCLAAWLAQCALSLTVLPIAPVGAEIFFSCVLYPMLAVWLIRAHRGPAAVELA